MSDSRRRRHGVGLKTRLDNGDSYNTRTHSGGGGGFPQRSRTNANLHRMNSHDRVRKIVQEEGRTARNLVQYNVPLESQSERTGRSSVRQVRKLHRGSRTGSSSSPGNSLSKTPPPYSQFDPKFMGDLTKSPKSENAIRQDKRARYWKFLFDNLQMAVDAIYDQCEIDESIVECKEVIMMLEQSTNDFRCLIDRLNLLERYETATRDGDKPPSLAWEVRKMSPGKNQQREMHSRSSPSPAQRVLTFQSAPPAGHPSPSPQSALVLGSVGNSWADKVRGPVLQPPCPRPTELASPVSGSTGDDGPPTDEDGEGWETVHRGGKPRSRNSPPQRDSELSSPSSRHNLRKSLSVPESKSLDKASTPVPANPTPHRFTSELSLSSFRDRSGSKDSEKENIPLSDPNVPFTQPLEVMTSFKDPQSSSPQKHCSVSSALSDEDDDTFTEQIDSAIAKVGDEEDTLTEQLQEEQDTAIKTAIEVEETWLKELAKEENTDIDVETETEESELGNTHSSMENSQGPQDWEAICAEYAERERLGQKKSWNEMVEEAEKQDEKQDEKPGDYRTPGHGVHMHEKLSSPSRRRSPTESRRRHEEKQAKAQELREKLMQEKAERLRFLSKKVEEARLMKEDLIYQRKVTMKKKLERAEASRRSHLKQKAFKAHDDMNKVNEVAFIMTMGAQNKRAEIRSKHEECEARLKDLTEERQRKLEEKQAKEAAVEGRRRLLEAERRAKLQEMQEKRKLRDARVEQQQAEREKERQEIARAKEKEREERLAALNAQQQAHKEELQKKIQQKQDESSQRHEEILQQIRTKAFEMSVLRHSTEDHSDAPLITPYEINKICTICNALISSEVYLQSHLRGKKHQLALQENNLGVTLSKQEIESFNLKHIIDVADASSHPKMITEKERQKSLKKRCKKLKQRMQSRGLEYENSLANKQQAVDSEHKAKLQKLVKDMTKYLQSSDTGPWPQNRVSALDRTLGELTRILEKKMVPDQVCFREMGGVSSLSRLLLTIDAATPSLPTVIPPKSLSHVCEVYRAACKGCFDNCHYVLFSNKIGCLVDHLIQRLTLHMGEEASKAGSKAGSRPGSGSSSGGKGQGEKSGTVAAVAGRRSWDPVAASLLQLLASVLTCLAKSDPASNASQASAQRTSSSGDASANRGTDVISYIVSVGVVDRLAQYLNEVRGPVDQDKEATEFLMASLAFLGAVTKFMAKRWSSSSARKGEEPTGLVTTLEVTQLVGIVSLLYGMLLHSGAPCRGDSPPPELPAPTLNITLHGLRLLNHMAALDLHMLQRALGEEGMSLEFRHIASFLLWYCSHRGAEELLHEVILCVGHFTVLCHDNQVVLQSGMPPTVLQQLCSLPFQYFSDPRLTAVLFPTLISCCHDNPANRLILEQELSTALLANFLEEKTLEQQHDKSPAPSSGKKGKTAVAGDKEAREADPRMALTARFPPDKWAEARDFLASETSSEPAELLS